MRELKQIIHNATEKELGARLVNQYSKDSATLLDKYSEFNKAITREFQSGEITWEEYMEKRNPVFAQYKKDDKELYDKFVSDARALGYEAGSE